MMFCSSVPCAVAINWTPLWDIVRAAAHSNSVPNARTTTAMDSQSGSRETYLVDDDDLRHVVLHSFDHDLVLSARMRHLHPPSSADARMRYVSVPGDLIRRVHDDHALLLDVCQLLAHGPNGGRLSPSLTGASRPMEERHASAAAYRVSEKENGFAFPDDVRHHRRAADDVSTDPGRQSDHLSPSVLDAADAMQRPADPCSIISSELAQLQAAGFRRNPLHL